MTAVGQHSMVPPFYANRAKVAPRARTAHTTRTAREAPSLTPGMLVHLGIAEQKNGLTRPDPLG